MTPEELRKWCEHLDIRLASTSVLVTTLLAEQRALRHVLRVALARESLTVQQFEAAYQSALEAEAPKAAAELERSFRCSTVEQHHWQPPEPPPASGN